MKTSNDTNYASVRTRHADFKIFLLFLVFVLHTTFLIESSKISSNIDALSILHVDQMKNVMKSDYNDSYLELSSSRSLFCSEVILSNLFSIFCTSTAFLLQEYCKNIGTMQSAI